MTKVLASLWTLVVLSLPAQAHQWLPHNGMTDSSWKLAAAVQGDPELEAFLRDFEEDIESRAGNKPLDEDHTEGRADDVMGLCWLNEPSCGPFCTVDHFFPRLSLSNQDAISHADYYFDLAVRFYRSSRCTRTSLALREGHRRYAARALGHAVHLVEDMGVPQHVSQEAHVPPWVAVVGHGLNRSFFEDWTTSWWADPLQYGTQFQLGVFSAAAAAATTPREGPLRTIMYNMAQETRGFPSMSRIRRAPVSRSRCCRMCSRPSRWTARGRTRTTSRAGRPRSVVGC